MISFHPPSHSRLGGTCCWGKEETEPQSGKQGEGFQAGAGLFRSDFHGAVPGVPPESTPHHHHSLKDAKLSPRPCSLGTPPMLREAKRHGWSLSDTELQSSQSSEGLLSVLISMLSYGSREGPWHGHS